MSQTEPNSSMTPSRLRHPKPPRGIGLAPARRVTVRIIVEETAPYLRVRIEGRLTADEIGELAGVLAEDLAHTELDLCELRAVDSVGLGVLRRLRDEGAKLLNVPPRLAFDLEE